MHHSFLIGRFRNPARSHRYPKLRIWSQFRCDDGKYEGFSLTLIRDSVSMTALRSADRFRLAIVVSHPIQHFCPMYRNIAADPRADLLVIFAEAGAAPRFDSGFGQVIKWQDDLLEGFRHTMIGADKAHRSEAVLSQLERFGPDVVYVHGYAPPYLRATIRWANRSKIPVLMTTDSELRHPRPWHVRLAKRFALPPVLRNVSLFLTVGDENERYFRHYGVGNDRFHRVPFSIDSAYYDKILANQTEVRENLRKCLGIPPDTTAILTVGKMIPRKEHGSLIRAFGASLKQANGPAVLLIAGDGPLRPQLEELAKPLGSAVRLLGFIGVQQLPEYYSAADVYVHPSSHDPHPLAISEALYCGLPVVVSDRIGSTGPTDDVQVEVNGWEYPNGDEAGLSKILAHLIDHPNVRIQSGARSRELGHLHAADHCATRFVDGAVRAMNTRKAKLA
jgi:glycosyltransferase involved in cell wall biosynthesis